MSCSRLWFTLSSAGRESESSVFCQNVCFNRTANRNSTRTQKDWCKTNNKNIYSHIPYASQSHWTIERANVMFTVKYVIKINFIRINSKLESRQRDKVKTWKSRKKTKTYTRAQIKRLTKYAKGKQVREYSSFYAQFYWSEKSKYMKAIDKKAFSYFFFAYLFIYLRFILRPMISISAYSSLLFSFIRRKSKPTTNSHGLKYGLAHAFEWLETKCVVHCSSIKTPLNAWNHLRNFSGTLKVSKVIYFNHYFLKINTEYFL